MRSGLAIDTSPGSNAGSSSSKSRFRRRSISPLSNPAGPRSLPNRGRSISNASTASTLSIVSPKSSSTNASTTSLLIPTARHSSRSRSPSPALEETVKLGPDRVLAMHDYSPADETTIYLSFRAGQIIEVLNRHSSGWWDGKLEGRRGWFPSNYVNDAITSLTQEEPIGMSSSVRLGHRYTQSSASATSWTTTSSDARSHRSDRTHHRSRSDASEQDVDPSCPPLMTPLLHGLSLLQNVVRANRLEHFQPSTACIISCVRSILASTGTLQRDSEILKDFPRLSDERKRILTSLASLVAKAKEASEGDPDPAVHAAKVEAMMRLGGQVFAHVRRFLALGVSLGIELGEQDIPPTATPGSAESQIYMTDDTDSPTKTPTQHRGRNGKGPMPRQAMRIGGPRSRERPSDSPGSPTLAKTLARARQEQHLLRERTNRHRSGPSVSSLDSLSSIDSQDSIPRSPPPFPHGPSSAVQVLEALRFTHDHYLSTIAAFIGHAHSHSRTSHASSTGVLYDLVKEIVEMVCKLLTIVEAVMQHPDISPNRVGNLRSTKEGLYQVTSSLAESVRLLTLSLPPTMTEEEEKQILLRSATGALKAGADCVASVKICLTRPIGDRPFIVELPNAENVMSDPFAPPKPSTPQISSAARLGTRSRSNSYHLNGMEDEDLTIQAQTPSPVQRHRQVSSSSENSTGSKTSWINSDDTRATSPDDGQVVTVPVSQPSVEPDLPSPTSFAHTDDDGTTWEGSTRGHLTARALEEKLIRGDLPTVPLNPIPQLNQNPDAWMHGHDYPNEDVAYNTEGHLVGATMGVLIEKMTPHDSIVDPAFSSVFFLTFRLFSSPTELVEAIIARYNLTPPASMPPEYLPVWQHQKGVPVRLRLSNFIKTWLDTYWKPGVDDVAIPALTAFTKDALVQYFPQPAQRILELLAMWRQSSDSTVGPKADRSRDPGMSINPPQAITPTSGEIPRPTMTKTLLVALRKKDFTSIHITDFDALELSRQLTITECNLYCAIQADEILSSGQEGATPPVNVKAVTSLSTVITGWVAESILNEPDLKKRTNLVKFFVKVADGLPQKYKTLLEGLRRLADHSRNYHEYRSKLRNTAPPAVPFLGLYLTDVTFCREGNPSHRASPADANKKLLNFNKYHKLARIVQDMQRFQVPYNLKAIPEVQEYLNDAFEKSKHHGDLQDLYRRSLLVEPKQTQGDNPPTSDVRQLFSWATRSQPQHAS
ncbi:hypothetical protein CVT24_004368 [Panaeolus cyanescens]|uniref:Ras GEF n=1 Tax=Panaeolus cyanescens TaxID=181874 RepID=A0A409V9Z3_9AGAR|nr:hypothetical protein CVT24_004368 [Panaeolus cyanescens]